MSGIGIFAQCNVCFDTGRIPHGDCTTYCWCQSGKEVAEIDRKAATQVEPIVKSPRKDWQKASNLLNNGYSTADFSECGEYRYTLSRTWASGPKVMFIGLNPSIANAQRLDPTMRRVIGFAKDLGYGGVCMVNCFPCVATDPKNIQRDNNREIENLAKIAALSEECADVIFAWGTHRMIRDSGRDKTFESFFPNALALKLTKNGHPSHPLYLPKNLKPIKFKP